MGPLDQLLQTVGSQGAVEYLFGKCQISKAGNLYWDEQINLRVDSLQSAFGEMARMHEVVEDIRKMPTLVSVYAHRNRTVTRSDHLRFCWTLFINKVYMYLERTKNLFGALNGGLHNFIDYEPLDASSEIKWARVTLDEFIKERGASTHEWVIQRDELRVVEMMEVLSSVEGRAEHWNLKDHFDDARQVMRHLQRKVSVIVIGRFNSYVEYYTKAIIDVCSDISQRVCDIERNGYVVTWERGPRPKGRSMIGAIPS